MLGDLRGGGHGAVPVEADDAAERGQRIDVVRGQERLVDVVGGCQPAGVGVLHDDRGGPLEVHADVHGLVQVQDVVVGQLLPVELLGLGHGGAGCEGILVERGLLVGVLAVPEVLDLLGRYGERVREAVPEPLEHLRGDHVVVVGGEDERLGHQLLVGLLRECAGSLQLLDDAVVLTGFGDHGHVLVVLGRRPDHARTADVDVLDDLVEGHTLFQNGLFERIQVDDHHVDGFDPLLRDGVHVLLDVPAGQDARVDLRMEGLDAPLEHLRESRDVGDLHDRDARFFENLVSAAGGDDLHAHGGQRPGEIDYAGFVRHADDCPFDLGHVYPRKPIRRAISAKAHLRMRAINPLHLVKPWGRGSEIRRRTAESVHRRSDALGSWKGSRYAYTVRFRHTWSAHTDTKYARNPASSG